MTGPGVDAGPAAPPAKPMNTRVLVVDDQQQIHDDFREMLLPLRTTAASDDLVAAFLDPRSQPSGLALPPFDLRHARTGEEGCAAIAQAHDRNEPIAVAFVDVRMPPGIDGVEAVRRMRAVDRDLEVVIMTAYSDKPLSAIIGDVGLLHKILYVRKPFAREEVQQISGSAAGPPSPSTSASWPRPTATWKPPSATGRSGRTCTTVWRCFPSTCRRCGSGTRTSRCWRSTSGRSTPSGSAPP